MMIFEILFLIILGALFFASIFVIKSKIKKNSDFKHLELLYSLEKSEIIIDKFTAHKIKFDLVENWRKYRNIELKYNYKDTNYFLIIKHISNEH